MIAWRNPGMPIILASQSPRRRDILSAMGVAFSVSPPPDDVEETAIDCENISESIQALALRKARSVARSNPDSLVLGGDTVVVHESAVLGKPKDRAEAFSMLMKLSGKVHQVYSGVALICPRDSFSATAVACTNVLFRRLSEIEIERYLDSGEYADKAGAYGIQGAALIFIDGIEGCFYNVVGLPVSKTIDLFNAYIR